MISNSERPAGGSVEPTLVGSKAQIGAAPSANASHAMHAHKTKPSECLAVHRGRIFHCPSSGWCEAWSIAAYQGEMTACAGAWRLFRRSDEFTFLGAGPAIFLGLACLAEPVRFLAHNALVDQGEVKQEHLAEVGAP